MNFLGSEANRKTTRVSSVSPRLASNNAGSVPSPDTDCTVVSSVTASMMSVFTSPPISGQRTSQTPELSRFSEQDDLKTKNAARKASRGRIDETFPKLFHGKG